jgi:glutathione S-transferase
MIAIYGGPGSRAARCLWALEELALPYEMRSVDNADSSGRSAAYLAINPTGKVPYLVDGDVAISESYAINLHLARSYGDGTLWPAGRAGQAAALQWSFWVATETEPHIATLFAEHFQKSDAERSQATIDRSNAAMAARMGFLDDTLADRAYLTGETFTIADLNVAAGLRNAAKLKVDLTPFANVSRWLGVCLGRDAHLKVLALAAG